MKLLLVILSFASVTMNPAQASICTKKYKEFKATLSAGNEKIRSIAATPEQTDEQINFAAVEIAASLLNGITDFTNSGCVDNKKSVEVSLEGKDYITTCETLFGSVIALQIAAAESDGKLALTQQSMQASSIAPTEEEKKSFASAIEKNSNIREAAKNFSRTFKRNCLN